MSEQRLSKHMTSFPIFLGILLLTLARTYTHTRIHSPTSPHIPQYPQLLDRLLAPAPCERMAARDIAHEFASLSWYTERHPLYEAPVNPTQVTTTTRVASPQRTAGMGSISEFLSFLSNISHRNGAHTQHTLTLICRRARTRHGPTARALAHTHTDTNTHKHTHTNTYKHLRAHAHTAPSVRVAAAVNTKAVEQLQQLQQLQQGQCARTQPVVVATSPALNRDADSGVCSSSNSPTPPHVAAVPAPAPRMACEQGNWRARETRLSLVCAQRGLSEVSLWLRGKHASLVAHCVCRSSFSGCELPFPLDLHDVLARLNDLPTHQRILTQFHAHSLIRTLTHPHANAHAHADTATTAAARLYCMEEDLGSDSSADSLTCLLGTDDDHDNRCLESREQEQQQEQPYAIPRVSPATTTGVFAAR